MMTFKKRVAWLSVGLVLASVGFAGASHAGDVSELMSCMDELVPWSDVAGQGKYIPKVTEVIFVNPKNFKSKKTKSKKKLKHAEEDTHHSSMDEHHGDDDIKPVTKTITLKASALLLPGEYSGGKAGLHRFSGDVALFHPFSDSANAALKKGAQKFILKTSTGGREVEVNYPFNQAAPSSQEEGFQSLGIDHLNPSVLGVFKKELATRVDGLTSTFEKRNKQPTGTVGDVKVPPGFLSGPKATEAAKAKAEAGIRREVYVSAIDKCLSLKAVKDDAGLRAKLQSQRKLIDPASSGGGSSSGVALPSAGVAQ